MSSLKVFSRRPIRSAMGLAGALVLLGALGGCGNKLEEASTGSTAVDAPESTSIASSTTESEQPTTTKAGELTGTNSGLGAKLGGEAVSLPGLDTGSDSTEDAFGADVEQCLDQEASGLSASDAESVQNDDDFSGLSEEGTRIVTDAMNTCIPADSLGDLFATEFFKSLGSEPNPEFTSCLTTELDGQVGDVLLQSAAASKAGDDAIPQPVLDVLDACGDIIIGDLFADQFVKAGLSEETARCIADGLGGKLTMSGLVEMGQGGEIPADLEAEITSLAQSCAAGG